MLTKLKVALILSASLIGGVAAAHGFSGADKAALLQKYDTNGDGKLDDTERAAMKADFAAKRAEKKAQMLAKYDTNKNGKLDPAERKVMRDDKLTARFEKLDTNHDGQVSIAEFKAGAKLGHHHHGHRGHGKVVKGTAGGQGSAGGQP